MIIATMLFAGINSVNAATTLPDSVVSDGIREVEYIENFPVIVKTAEGGKYYIYCMNMSATYGGGIKFSKKEAVDPGYLYILNNLPNTGDKDKDFYIAQIAVWYYDDYLTQTNFNLVSDVKKYILVHKDTEEVSREIYKLYDGAKKYQEKKARLELSQDKVTFIEKDGYYVSSEIKVYAENLKGNENYRLTNAPIGSQVVKSENGVIVRIPVSGVPAGKQVTVTMDVTGEYEKQTPFYYFYNDSYQKMLFQDPLDEIKEISTSIKMTVAKRDKYTIDISKTDITQANEVEGATLVVKDENGKTIESWVSTKDPHHITLQPGKYTLTETIAPDGYKLSKTTIYFMLDESGSLYVKNEKGTYVVVDRVVMINELLDVVSFAKKDSKTEKYVSGATLVIKDSQGKTIDEFTTTGSVYQTTLKPGEYTLSEVKAPDGYVLSKEVIYFQIMEDGTLQIKDKSGDYQDSVIVTYYNTPKKEEVVNVPATDANQTLLIIGGIALLIGGVACAKKTIKEC